MHYGDQVAMLLEKKRENEALRHQIVAVRKALSKKGIPFGDENVSATMVDSLDPLGATLVLMSERTYLSSVLDSLLEAHDIAMTLEWEARNGMTADEAVAQGAPWETVAPGALVLE